MSEPDIGVFYDDLSADYDLIFESWERSMARQGDTILGLLGRYLPHAESPLRVLDTAAGIGTQSLPLAQRGCSLTCRDLSPAAIARLRREAAARGLQLDAGVADMRSVDQTVAQPFDVVLAFDNAVPHLQTDDDVATAFRAFFRALRPGGVCLLSVRDYEQVERGVDRVQPYGVRWREGKRHVPLQVWHWVDADHYDVSFYFIVDEPHGAQVRCTTARYYAVSAARLLELMSSAGFEQCERNDETIYGPILLGRRPG
ncbi:MAG TPA: class I SAM-dependent methyltransferase [Polyangiaceae bacterium]|nr:class I SAM-dependent methyltransferase [Polyangiaceae bacterium]